MSETATIARLASQGEGETDDGRFVPFALPGERITFAPVAADRARLLEVVDASPERQAPLCAHFGSCGGCALQHASAALYRDWKQKAVKTAFAQRGLDVTPDALEPVPVGSRRRAVFAAVRERGRVVLGFHAARSNAIVGISECPVLLPSLAAALPALRDLAAPLLPRKGALRLTVTATDQGLAVDAADGASELGLPLREAAGRAARAGRFARVTLDGDMLFTAGAPTVTLSGVPVPFPPAAFLQATAPSEAAMVQRIVAAAAGSKRAADLFAGLGTFTFALARVMPVTAVESDPAACNALAEAVRRAAGLKPITVLRRDLIREPLAGRELDPFDVVVFDPPRAGAQGQARALAASRVATVIAVSCYPATLARDVRLLIDAGYQLSALTPVDQFLFTPHIEAIAVLRRRQSASRKVRISFRYETR